MSKTKYRFDPESLVYNRIVLSGKQKAIRLIKQLVAVGAISTVLIMGLSLFFDTPGELRQKRENKMLLEQYNNLNKKLDQITNSMEKIEERDDNIYRLIFGIDPISDEKRKAGAGGTNQYEEFENLSEGELVIETSKKIDALRRQMAIQSLSFNEVIQLAKKQEEYLIALPSISPIADKDLTRFASGYGYRIHPIYRTRKMHTGIDLTAPTGTSVFATGNGVVVEAEYSPDGYGKRVLVDHGFGFKTLYAHLHDIRVRKGQKIRRGEIVGTVGNTGRSTAPHLHYEVRRNNHTENPVNYYFNDLTPEQYEEVILVSSRMNMSFD